MIDYEKEGKVVEFRNSKSDNKSNKTPKIGFNLVSWDLTGTVDTNTWKKTVQEMYRADIRSLTIVTYRFVDKKTGSISPTSTYGLAPPPGNDEIMTALKEAKNLGMHVSLNPFIEIDNPNGIGYEWRGNLNYSDDKLQIFFKNYKDYIAEMAKLAETAGIDRLYVGSELKALSGNPKTQQLWSQVIFEARQILSMGTLSYAANHDEYKDVPFWNQLDEIGIDAYFSLASQSQAKGVGNPSVSVIETNWKGLFNSLKKFSNHYEKPVVISEWGVVPFDLTTYQPWNWNPSLTSDPEEQINAYKATIDAVISQGDWLREIQFWHWGGMTGSLESRYSITSDSRVGEFISHYIAEKYHE